MFATQILADALQFKPSLDQGGHWRRVDPTKMVTEACQREGDGYITFYFTPDIGRCLDGMTPGSLTLTYIGDDGSRLEKVLETGYVGFEDALKAVKGDHLTWKELLS